MFQSEQLQEKWKPLLEAEGVEKITDPHRKAVTAVLLENQERFLRESTAFGESGMLNEAVPTNSTGSNTAGLAGAGNAGFSASANAQGPVAGFDPVLISLIRRSMPNLVAYDLAGVQPMSGPTGLIFAMRSKYNAMAGGSGGQESTEAFYNEPDSAFSSQNSDFGLGLSPDAAVGLGTTNQSGNNPAALNPVGTATSTGSGGYSVGTGMQTQMAEGLGDSDSFNQMAFSIEKVTVTAKSRALKAEYSLELAQDLKAIHGLKCRSRTC